MLAHCLLLLSALGVHTLALTAGVLQACCMCVACRCEFEFHSLAVPCEHSASVLLAVLLSLLAFLVHALYKVQVMTWGLLSCILSGQVGVIDTATLLLGRERKQGCGMETSIGNFHPSAGALVVEGQ